MPDEDSATFSKGLPASTIGPGESKGSALSKVPTPQQICSLQDGTGQPSSQGEGIVTKFLEGLAPGDPGYEQLEPERLSQTHFLHRPGSLDWDENNGGAPTTPPSIGPTLTTATSPPPLPLPPAALEASTVAACSVQPCVANTDSSLATQLYGDEDGGSIAFVAPPCDDVHCPPFIEDMPGTQFYEAMPEAQLCEHSSGAQLRKASPPKQVSAEVVKDLPVTELCKNLPDTQLREDLPDTQHCEDVMPRLPGQQVREDQLRSHACEDVPCTQMRGDLPGTQEYESLPGPPAREELPNTGSQPFEYQPTVQPFVDSSVCAHSSGAVGNPTSLREAIITEEHTGDKSTEEVVAPPTEVKAMKVAPVRPARSPKGKAGLASKGGKAIAKSSVEQSPGASSMGHTLQPPQQGLRVAVVGDGWGDRDGGYEAVVTEADHYTFTVIATSGKHPWTENHVLKENCIFLSEASSTSEKAPAAPINRRPSPSEKAPPAHTSKRQRRSSGKRKS